MRCDNKRLEYIGKRYLSNNCGYCTIVQYINTKKVLIRFDETGYERWTSIVNIKSGEVRDPMQPSVFGVGIFGDTYPSRENGIPVKPVLEVGDSEVCPWVAGAQQYLGDPVVLLDLVIQEYLLDLEPP